MVSCASPPPPRVLTAQEQIRADTEKAASLAKDFREQATFLDSIPRVERFLYRMASRLSQSSKSVPLEKVEVRIHRDPEGEWARAFSFPGTLISVPISFLKEVEYENELAGFLAFEMGNVVNRHLAIRVEAARDRGAKLAIFGPGGLFDWLPGERAQSIGSATEMVYWAGYDVRGVASMFQRYPRFFGNGGTDPLQKQVEFNVREAQRARIDLMPSLKPIVRSAEFIEFKRELERVR